MPIENLEADKNGPLARQITTLQSRAQQIECRTELVNFGCTLLLRSTTQPNSSA